MFKYIRINNAAICFSLFGLGSLLIASLIMPFISLCSGSPARRRKALSVCIQKSWQLFVLLMKTLRLIKVEISPQDLNRLQNLRGTIVAANHPTFIDVVIMVSLTPNPICVVKGKLTRNFFVKHIVLGAYINNETEPDVFLEQCKTALDQGYNLVVFPEGTRTYYDREMKLQRGTAYAANLSRAHIQPVHISTSERILGKNQKWYHVGLKRVVYKFTLKDAINPKVFYNPDKSGHVNAKTITQALKIAIEN